MDIYCHCLNVKVSFIPTLNKKNRYFWILFIWLGSSFWKLVTQRSRKYFYNISPFVNEILLCQWWNIGRLKNPIFSHILNQLRDNFFCFLMCIMIMWWVVVLHEMENFWNKLYGCSLITSKIWFLWMIYKLRLQPIE